MITRCVQIVSSRFTLRPLDVHDVTERYSGWLSNQETSRYITAKLDIFQLRRYVAERLNRDDVLFLGIFEKNSGLHIGNIKYEPINSELRYAIAGILIGDPAWRGKGVAAEVLLVTASWLYHNHNIRKIILGVHKLNYAAIRAYSKVGFNKQANELIQNHGPDNLTMVWNICNMDLLDG